MRSLARIPPGVQTYLDDAVALRRQVERQVLEVFAGWGYGEIALPVFDYFDLFVAAMGEGIGDRTYRFTDREGGLLALRPDFTSLVARTVATRLGDRPRPLRLCYSGEVFRYDEPRHGRQNEFHQIGLEHVGSSTLDADLEVLVVALEALDRLGARSATVSLSHGGFLRGLFEERDLCARDASDLREILARRATGELALRLEALGLAQDALGQLPHLAGEHALETARGLARGPRALAAVRELEALVTAATELGFEDRLAVDLGEVSGYDYYTGLTLRIYAPGVGAEIGSGGRYDELLGTLGQPEPAVGLVFFLDNLLMLPGCAAVAPQARPERISGNSLTERFASAVELRRQGRRIALS